MTACAIDGEVRASEREVCEVVIKRDIRPYYLVVTDNAISRIAFGLVIGIGSAIVIIEVTAYTGVRRVVVIAVMTDDTIIRNSRMRTSQRIVHTMIKSTGYPGCF